MIDLHAHILPGIDDGARDDSMALEMAQQAVERGVKIVAATPHYLGDPDWNSIKSMVEELNQKLAKNNIQLQVVSGAELFIDPDLEKMTKEQIPTYNDNGRYCLIEFPMLDLPYYVDQVLFSLSVKGITPIIAHPERYHYVGEDPNIVSTWIDSGCLLQMNAGSVLGVFGKSIKKTAEIMLKHDMVHILASDAHSANRRSFILDQCVIEAGKLVSTENVARLVETYPQLVIAGEAVEVTAPRVYRPRKRFWLF